MLLDADSSFPNRPARESAWSRFWKPRASSRTRRRTAAPVVADVEHLEQRRMLTIQSLFSGNDQRVQFDTDALPGAPQASITLNGANAQQGDQILISHAAAPGSTTDIRQVFVIDTNGFFRVKHLDAAIAAGQEDPFGTSLVLPPNLYVNVNGTEQAFLKARVNSIDVITTEAAQGILRLRLVGAPANDSGTLAGATVTWNITIPLTTPATGSTPVDATRIQVDTAVTFAQAVEIPTNRQTNAEGFRVGSFSSSNVPGSNTTSGQRTHDADRLRILNAQGAERTQLDLNAAPTNALLFANGFSTNGAIRLSQDTPAPLNTDPPNIQMRVVSPERNIKYRAQGFVTVNGTIDENSDNVGVWLNRALTDDSGNPITTLPAGTRMEWTLDIIASDDAAPDSGPLIDRIGETQTFTENQPNGQRIAARSTVLDLDTTAFDGARLTVTIAGNGQATDLLRIRNEGSAAGMVSTNGSNVLFGGTVVGTISGGTGTTPLVVNFTGAGATKAAIQAVIRNVQFVSNSNTPSVTDRSIRFELTDGDGGTAPQILKSLAVAATNDAPVIGQRGPAITVRANDPAEQVAPNATVVDPDSTNLQGGTLTATISANSATEDRLEIRNQGTAAGQIGVSGTNVTFGGTTIGAFSGGTGSTPLTIALNALAATPAAVQALLQNITFRTTAATAGQPRTVGFQVTDGDGGTSRVVSKTVTVTIASAAPQIANLGATVAFTSGQAAPTVIADQATVTDADSTNLNGGTLTVSLTNNREAADVLSVKNTGTAAGQISVSGTTVSFGGTPIGTIAGGTSNADLVVTLNSTSATVAAVQQLVRSIQYNNAAATPGTQPRTVRFLLNDGAGGISAPQTKTITVATTSNAAPQVTNFGGSVAFSQTSGEPVAVTTTGEVNDTNSTDFNGGSLTATLTTNSATGDALSIANIGTGTGQIGVSGTSVTFGGTAIGTFTGGTGSTPLVVTFTSAAATPDAAEALLRALRYDTTTPTTSTQPRTISVVVNDGDQGVSTAVTKQITLGT